MKVLVWNLKWASPGSPRGQRIRERLSMLDPEVAVLTEVKDAPFFEGGYSISSGPDYGYPIIKGRRKVRLWSRRPWEDVDTLGHPDLPSGRFVAGTTESSIGRLTVLGVCIPWSRAHVSTGKKNRKPWEDHLRYLEGLKAILEESRLPSRTFVAGDFNQRIPRTRQPRAVFDALMNAIPSGWSIGTSGALPDMDAQLIDHLVAHPSLKVSYRSAFDPQASNGKMLSDHLGVTVEVGLNNPEDAP